MLPSLRRTPAAGNEARVVIGVDGRSAPDPMFGGTPGRVAALDQQRAHAEGVADTVDRLRDGVGIDEGTPHLARDAVVPVGRDAKKRAEAFVGGDDLAIAPQAVI